MKRWHRSPSQQIGQRAAMGGVDIDRGAHARPQRKIPRLAVDADTHRDALHHLAPVAVRLLRRKDRELRAAGGTDALNRARPYLAWIACDQHVHMVARFDVSEVGFL